MKNKLSKFLLHASILLFSLHFFVPAVGAETLKIGFVTDWEYGSRSRYSHKLPKKAEKYLRTAIDHFNGVFLPDLVVGGGDYVLGAGVKKKKAIRQLQYINNIFKTTSAPRLYCIGNHDLSKMSKEEIEEILDIDAAHSSTDINGFRVLVVDTNHRVSGQKKYHATGRISDGELAWLEEQLDTQLPVVVFSHHSFIQTPQGGLWRSNIFDVSSAREALERNSNVAAVVSGHHAVNYTTEHNGINYVIINNLTDERARGTFADITLEKDELSGEVRISIEQYGKRPAQYELTSDI